MQIDLHSDAQAPDATRNDLLILLLLVRPKYTQDYPNIYPRP